MPEAVTIISEGVRMAGDLFVPDGASAQAPLPAILLCHGWAGPKSHLNATYAPFFSAAGFVCLTFDYRGWYESDSRLVTLEPQGAPGADGVLSVRARPVREVVDPLDQNRDIHNAIDFLLSDARVDRTRLGLWGSSFGGGHVIYLAGTDPRVKCVVSQVPGMGPAADESGFTHRDPEGDRIAERMARGELAVVPRPAGMPDSLKGAGDFRTMWQYQPRRAAANIRVPTLIIDQENEEYGGRENSGLAARENVPSSTTVEYHVLPGTHYDIYDKNYKESARLARDWFVKHL